MLLKASVLKTGTRLCATLVTEWHGLSRAIVAVTNLEAQPRENRSGASGKAKPFSRARGGARSEAMIGAPITVLGGVSDHSLLSAFPTAVMRAESRGNSCEMSIKSSSS